VATEGLTLRQAALIAGFAYLLNPITYAEFTIMPKLLVPGRVEQTIANIASHQGAFVLALFCYFINFIEDVVIAWALYVLLAPVNTSLSLLAALFRLIYTAVALFATFNLSTVYRMVTTPEYARGFGARQFGAQVDLLLHSFRYDWSLSLLIFGIHLVLVGYLIYRSTYIPKILGIILVLDGLGWLVNSIAPYALPNVNLEYLFVTFFGELIFMLWLLIAGWRIRPVTAA
jgi:hypothetical protein